MLKNILFITYCLVFLLFSTFSLAAEVLQEDELKAVFVYNFLKFVDWPEKTCPEKEITLCIVGETSLVDYLLSLDGQKIKDKSLVVSVEKDFSNLKKCHAIFVGHLPRSDLKNLLWHIKKLPILTVSDLRDFVHKGGMIEIYEENKKIRFKINLKRAHEVNLKISSRLLRLAKEVVK